MPLTIRSIEALRALRVDTSTPDDLVFPISVGSLKQAWRRLCERAGVTGFRFQDLRHEAVSRLFEKGLKVMEVSAISGHRELKMLRRYTYLSADNLVARMG